jgi:hypothetical protein
MSDSKLLYKMVVLIILVAIAIILGVLIARIGAGTKDYEDPYS